jgi:ubiquinone/menaquinone biosynthesis C-methylase UbiE
MRGVEQIPWLYDGMCRLLEATGLSRWRAWLTRGAKGPVLEVGCGTGRNLPLYEAGLTVVGVEPSLEALERARSRAPGTPLVCASAEALPFRDGTFATVVSSLVFCSVPDVPKGLAEVKRVLAPDGELRMLEHVRSTFRLGGWWDDFIQPVWTWAAGGCHPNRDTESAVREADFEIDAASLRAKGSMRRFRAHPRRP